MRTPSRSHLLATLAVLSTATFVYAEPATPAARPTIGMICTTCHKAEANVLRGNYENVAFKSKTISMKIDNTVELLTFDDLDMVVVTADKKTTDAEAVRKIAKGSEVKIEYTEKDGVRTAVKLTQKPPVSIAPDMLITTAELKKLVALGPQQGGYLLFDSRPLPKFQEGAIPTAVNLPYPAFDKLAPGLLPPDKNARIIFYCAGVTCSMSPGSAVKAKALGYTTIKVYKDGMPAWSKDNYGVLTVEALKAAWLDKDIPYVLLDVRPARIAAKGFIKGAVTFPAATVAKRLKSLPSKDKKPPVLIYDAKDGKQAARVANQLIAAGYGKVMVLSGGYQSWQAANYPAAKGRLAAKAIYTPKPHPGEIGLAEFKKYAAALPANVMIIDVRNPEETKDGMLKTATLIPAQDIKARMAEIPKDKLIITQCSTGVRAEMAYLTLKELGYTNVRFINARIDFEKDGSYEISKE